MGIFYTGTFLSYKQFLNGAGDKLLKNATFSPRSTSKKHNVDVCDLIITADTETSHRPKHYIPVEYEPPAEMDYLKGIKIKVPEDVRRDFADFDYIRRRAFGLRIYLSSKGHDIEELYAELVRLYGWDRTLVNRSDMLMDIIDFVADSKDEEERYKSIDTDIEVGWIYQWCICFYAGDNSTFVYGRLPSDMTACFNHISDVLNLSEDRRASIYFHNFGYDYQYLKAFISRDIDAGADVRDEYRLLATAPHKIISYQTTSGITFKCSYRLSNASLDFWSREIVFSKYKKLVGAVDYDVIRYQDTPLVRADWRYMIYDVLTDAECIAKTAEHEGDNMATIPLTSTGFVRRDGRKLFKKDKTARKAFIKSSIGERCYNVLRRAQAGGYVHASRYYAGQTADIEDIKQSMPDAIGIRHGDMRSFYPSMQQVELYPISRFICYAKNPDDDKIKHFLSDSTHAYLFVVAFDGCKLKDGLPFPVISASKALQGRIDRKIDLIEDNGRVLKASGQFILYLTNMDFKLIIKQYDCKLEVLEVWRARAGRLPGWMIDLINQYFKGKSDLKDKTKLYPDDYTLKSLLIKDKNKLNGIYGMTATDIVRTSFIEVAPGDWEAVAPDVAETLRKYYNNGNSFMRLEWGVWCTSWARYRLLELAEFIGWKYILYGDTDSIFYIATDDNITRVDAWNKRHEQRANKLGAYITTEAGKKINYDVFEDEGEYIIKFRALHSKCYAYVTKDGKLHATIAGVTAKGREEELQSIDNLHDGFTFHKCGGSTIKYYEDDITIDTFDGHWIEYASSAIITRTDKTISFNDFEDRGGEWISFAPEELLK